MVIARLVRNVQFMSSIHKNALHDRDKQQHSTAMISLPDIRQCETRHVHGSRPFVADGLIVMAWTFSGWYVLIDCDVHRQAMTSQWMAVSSLHCLPMRRQAMTSQWMS